MKAYGVNELRRMYLDFFESKEHLKMKSASLVPHNVNSLLIRYGAFKTLFYRAGNSAQEKGDDVPEVRAHGRY